MLEAPEAGELLETFLSTPVRTVLQGAGTQERVVEVRDAQGERREFLVTARPLRAPLPPPETLWWEVCPPSPGQGQFPSSAVVIWHDLAERRMREAALAAQERTRSLEAVFASMTDGLYVYGAQGRIVQLLPATGDCCADCRGSR